MDKLFSHSEQPLDAATTHAAHVVSLHTAPCLAHHHLLIQTAHMEVYRVRVQGGQIRGGRTLGTSLAAQVVQLGWRSELGGHSTASSYLDETGNPFDS